MGGWLHTGIVTHPSTNRTSCWLTLLMRSGCYQLSQITTRSVIIERNLLIDEFDSSHEDPIMNVLWRRHWTRREEADFYRVVSTFGVERDCETGQFIWDKFRLLARLERKLDNTLTEYFRAFYHMCLKVCRRFMTEEEGKCLLNLLYIIRANGVVLQKRLIMSLSDVNCIAFIF